MSLKIWLLVFIVIAAALRLFGLEDAQYRNDDETMFHLANRVLASGWPPVRGMHSSMGIDNGPTALYLLLTPIAFFKSQLAGTTFMALLNVVAVALNYLLVRRLFGPRIAFVATLLFATNTWSVAYSRRLWLNAALPLMTVLFFWSAFMLVREGGSEQAGDLSADSRRRLRWRAGLFGLALSGLVQTHLSGFVHIATAGLALLLVRERAIVFPVASAAFIIPTLPYLTIAFIPGLVRVVGRYVLSAAAAMGGTLTGPPIVFADWPRARMFFELLTSRGHQVYATQSSRLLDTTRGVFVLVDLLAIVGLLVGAAVLLRRARRDPHTPNRDLLLLAWVFLPLLIPGPAPSLRGFGHVYPVYLFVTLPGAFVLVAEGWEAMASWAWARQRVAHVALCTIAVLVAASHVAASVAFLAVRTEFWPMSADYGAPLAHTLKLTDLIRHRAGNLPILIGGHEMFADVWHRTVQHHSEAVAYFDDRYFLPIAPGPSAIYVTTDDSTWATEYLRSHFADSEESVVEIPGAGWKARIFRVATNRLEASLTSSDESEVASSNDVAMVTSVRQHEHATTGHNHDVTLHWHLREEPQVPHATQLIASDSAGRGFQSQSHELLPTLAWRSGDGKMLGQLRFVERFSLPISSDASPGLSSISMRFLQVWGGRTVADPIPLGQIHVLEAAR